MQVKRHRPYRVAHTTQVEFCRPCKRVKLAVSDESIYWCYYNHAICVGQWKAEEAGGKKGGGKAYLSEKVAQTQDHGG